jgi:hypothetical protein
LRADLHDGVVEEGNKGRAIIEEEINYKADHQFL